MSTGYPALSMGAHTVNIIELNHQSRPVPPEDVWAEDAVLAAPGTLAGLVSPGIPMRIPPPHPNPTSSKKRGRGRLLINVRSSAPGGHQTESRVPIKLFGAGVVRLEPDYEDGPIQSTPVTGTIELEQREDLRGLHGEGKDWGKALKSRHFWLLAGGAGVGALLVAALAIHELFLVNRENKKALPIELVEEANIEEVKGFEIGGTSEECARSMVALYAKAKTPQEVLPLIRNAQRLGARLNRDWQAWNASPDWQPSRNGTWVVSAEAGICHGSLTGQKPDFSMFRVYFVREGESLRIDWEATQGIGDVAFETLQRGVGTGGEIRAYISPANYYSQTFPESDYRSFGVASPDREQALWAYVKRKSPADAALLKVFDTGEVMGASTAEQPMTLRLTHGPDGSQKNQWLIADMLHIDWVSP